jgi:hypothetical protein
LKIVKVSKLTSSEKRWLGQNHGYAATDISGQTVYLHELIAGLVAIVDTDVN